MRINLWLQVGDDKDNSAPIETPSREVVIEPWTPTTLRFDVASGLVVRVVIEPEEADLW